MTRLMSWRVARAATRDGAGFTDEELDDLINRMMAALAEVTGQTLDADWKEELHKRDPDGKFTAGSGGAKVSRSEGQPQEAVEGKNPKSRMRNLLASGKPFTKQQLMEQAGITNEKTFTSWISMMKNPKFAGKAGALNIVRNPDGTYQVVKNGAGGENGSPPPTPPADPPKPPPEPSPPAPPPPAEPPAEPPAPAPARNRPADGKEKMFQSGTSQDLDNHFLRHYGIRFDQHGAGLGGRVVHIEDKGATAKHQRKMAREFARLFDDLIEMGVDLPQLHATVGGKLAISANLPKSSNSLGECWYRTNTFAKETVICIHGPKHAQKLEELVGRKKARKNAGKGPWTVDHAESFDAINTENYLRATIAHEYAHALAKAKIHDNGSFRADTEQHVGKLLKEQFGQDRSDMHMWIRENLSEYATTNIAETVAEMGAYFLSPGYMKKPLPPQYHEAMSKMFGLDPNARKEKP